MKKSFWFWLSFVIAIILATYFAARIITTQMGYGRTAIVKTISITSDSGNRDLSGLAASTGIVPGTRAGSLNLNDIQKRITNIPDVKSASVRRMPNGNISIHVKLHNAIAIWTDGQTLYPLSEDGTIINRQIDERPDSVVVFHGKLPENISQITKSARLIGHMLNYMEWIENRRWNMVMTNNITVLLPEENPTAAISALLIMEKKHKILSKDINILDMRDSARILVK